MAPMNKVTSISPLEYEDTFMRYSKSTSGFYEKDIHGDKIPGDAVVITKEKHAELMAGQAIGKHIVSDSEGRPMLAEPPPDPAAVVRTRSLRRVEDGRKQAEEEGVTYNGIRYAGDPGNRQALKEAIDLAEATGQETFASWKDSDGEFHSNHPVEDLRQALLAIASRRGELIEREAQLSAEIKAAAEAEDREALEAIHW